MHRHRIDWIALLETLNARRDAADAPRVAGKNERQFEIQDWMQPFDVGPALRAAEDLAEHQFLEGPPVRSYQMMCAARGLWHAVGRLGRRDHTSVGSPRNVNNGLPKHAA